MIIPKQNSQSHRRVIYEPNFEFAIYDCQRCCCWRQIVNYNNWSIISYDYYSDPVKWILASGLVRVYWFILNLIPSVAEPSVRVAHANRVHCARTRSCIATQGRICILLQFTQYHPLLAAGKSVVGSQTHSGAVEKMETLDGCAQLTSPGRILVF